MNYNSNVMNELKIRFSLIDYSCTDDLSLEDTLGDTRKMIENFCENLHLECEPYIFSDYLDEYHEMQGVKSFGYGFRIYRNFYKIDSPFFVRMMLEALAGFLRQSSLVVDVDNLEKTQ